VCQKRINIFQGNIVERTILLAQPTQKLLHLPALTANGGWGQAALIALVGGEIGKPIRKRIDVGLWFFQTSQEAQPACGRLDEEFSRPLEGLHTMTTVLLPSPAIRGYLDGWRANGLAAGDVDALGDYC